jgi:acyl-CoA thioesterase-2
MNDLLLGLVAHLDLEPLEVNLFRGQSREVGTRNVFGGQVIAQALVAAERTVEGRDPHSLHAYFLLPGDPAAPIVYQVERLRDGRSFSARRVQAIQHGRPILSMIASFQVAEPGLEHAASMPDVPPPDALAPSDEPRAWGAIEFRPATPEGRAARDPRHAVWFRTVDRVPDDPQLHRWLLAYASDWSLAGTALRPHGKAWDDEDMIVASLDHALWFHRPARVDGWLLYAMDSPTAQGARGLARGQIFDAGGRLVASVAQEALVRDVTLAPRGGR